MKLTFRDIIISKEAIDRLLDLRPSPLADVSHQIVYSARRMSEALEDFRESRKAIRSGYAEPDEEIPEDKRDAFKADIELLLDQEVDVQIRQISMEMIQRSEDKRTGFVIPQSDMYIAWYLFDFLDKEC